MAEPEGTLFCVFNDDAVPQKGCWGETEKTAWEMAWRIQHAPDENRMAFKKERIQRGYRAVGLIWDELKRAQGWDF